MLGGGGIFAAVSFAATGDGGAEFVDESSPQPVIAPTKINNAKTRSARCMREPPQMGMLLTVLTKQDAGATAEARANIGNWLTSDRQAVRCRVARTELF
jgi:hypothetical protein